MRRTAGVFVAVGLLAVMLVPAGGARAAGEVVVSTSPSQVPVGEPVEVLIRTFMPIAREGVLAMPDPGAAYPGPSGFYNVLYPWPDYPFDVIAEHEDGTDAAVTVARDPSDPTLWRGVTRLPKAGTWTIWVRNYPTKGPGSTTVVSAQAGSAPSIDARPAALIGALAGLVAGFGIARRPRRGLGS
ncbi:MAG TPA: hypothetical protein VGQ58_09785 [Candidatus Limnocylindrales bacterium]|jgi:hypothetical protein|nr:hypothetical protein [Candidatus Limnocylindrales bacterium]